MAASNELAMGWDEWARHDAIALAGLVRSGQVTARELVAQAAAGVDRVDPRLEAVLEVFDDVLANPDVDGPDHAGALYGVPIFLKDVNSGLKGRVQESGSPLMKGHVLTATDPTVENYLRAGMIPMGRSTTPEFAMTIDTTTNYLGRVKVTRNPWNPARTSGGSSGGASSVVASGITPISMATDGGGSIRIPAAFCGLVGLKPTRGRVPRPLHVSELIGRNSNDGVLSRSVRDTAVAFDYITRIPNGGSFIAMGPPGGSFLAALERDPGKLRVALSTGNWRRRGACDPQIAARIREVAKLLESFGHHVEEVDDAGICNFDLVFWNMTFQCIGTQNKLRGTARARGIDVADLPRHLSPMGRRMYEAEGRYGKDEVLQMMQQNNVVTRAFGAFMARYDVLLTPVVPMLVPAANGPFSLEIDRDLDDWIGTLMDGCRYTMPANETGLPALALPAGLDADGLPIGAQVYGNFRAEALLLHVGAQIERARPEWFSKYPPIHVTM